MGFYPFVPPSTAPSGPAGGVLSGTYPNPAFANPAAGPLNISGSISSLTSFVQATGALDASAAGFGLQVKEGANAKQQTAVLVAGTVTVANTSITANSKLLLSRSTLGGTPGHLSYTITAGTGYTINSSSATDTSTIVVEIVEPG